MSELVQRADRRAERERASGILLELIAERRPGLSARASQHPANELRGRSIAMGLIGPIAIRPRQFDALVGWPRLGRELRSWRRRPSRGQPSKVGPLGKLAAAPSRRQQGSNSDALGVARSATPSHCWWSDSGRRNTAVPAGDHADDTDAVVHEMSNERRASRSPCAKVLEFSENLSPLGLIVRVRN